MSQQNSDQKPAPDVWVGLLFVSVAALSLGIMFLVFELKKYDWQKDHQRNLTGTPEAYVPQGDMRSKEERASTTGDYEAWSPEA